MLRIYISHAMADKPYLDKLLKWLKPLQEQYFLRIFYNTPAYAARLPFHWDEMLNQLSEAHIYLFLTSYNSLSSFYIEKEEVPRAVEQLIERGEEQVRIFPIQVSPSLWKKQSRIAGFKPLGSGKTLKEAQPEEAEFMVIVEQLRLVIEELRRNLLEEHHRLGLSTEGFFRPELPPAEEAQFTRIPGWAGVVLVLVLFYMVTSWYFRGCAPRMYFMYTPKDLPSDVPDRYYRNSPVEPPQEVPLRLDEDTTGMRLQLPE